MIMNVLYFQALYLKIITDITLHKREKMFSKFKIKKSCKKLLIIINL